MAKSLLLVPHTEGYVNKKNFPHVFVLLCALWLPLCHGYHHKTHMQMVSDGWVGLWPKGRESILRQDPSSLFQATHTTCTSFTHTFQPCQAVHIQSMIGLIPHQPSPRCQPQCLES